MSVDTARLIIACIAAAGAITWLFGFRAFLRLLAAPHTLRAETTVTDVERDEARKAVLRAAVASTMLAVLKTDNPIVAEVQGQGRPRIAVEFAGAPGGTAVTAVADFTGLDRGCRIAGGLLAAAGLAAVVVLPTLLLVLRRAERASGRARPVHPDRPDGAPPLAAVPHRLGQPQGPAHRHVGGFESHRRRRNRRIGQVVRRSLRRPLHAFTIAVGVRRLRTRRRTRSPGARMEKGVPFAQSLELLLIRRALGDAAAEKAEFGKLSTSELEPITRGMLELSDWFNGLADAPGSRYMQSRWHRAAYFLYFLPANVIKARTVVSELSRTFCGLDSLSVLDVGSGPGSATLGLLDFVARETDIRTLRLEAIDQSHDALSDWRFLVDGYQKALAAEGASIQLSVRTHVADAATLAPPGGPWDIIFFGDTANELFRDADDPVKARADLLAAYADTLAEGGSLVIIEPALKTTSLALAQVRDALVAEHGLSIYAPCHGGGPCPMAVEEKPRDWCHTGVAWARPRIVARIDQIAGRKKFVVKFAYCVARRREESPVEAPPGQTVFRVAGDLLEEKGKRYALLCGLPGCVRFTLLNRDATDANEAFEHACRGDMLAIDAWDERKDGARLTKASRVRVLRRFS